MAEVRMAAAIGGGVLVALLLFLLMHALVGGREGFERGPDSGRVVDFVRVRPEEVVQIRERQVPREPPPAEEPPPPPRLETEARQQVTRQVLEIELPDIPIELSGGPALAASWQPANAGEDAEVIPIVRIEPQYPREALMRGIEGWVQLRITINPDGSVSDPVVIAAEPPRIFNREAMRAILRWKFRPRIVDGQPVSRQAEQIIEFRIDRDEPT
jgi:periplasmic protein TonB